MNKFRGYCGGATYNLFWHPIGHFSSIILFIPASDRGSSLLDSHLTQPRAETMSGHDSLQLIP